MANSQWDGRWTEDWGGRPAGLHGRVLFVVEPPTLSLGTEIPQETLGFRSQVYPEQGLGSGSLSPSVA